MSQPEPRAVDLDFVDDPTASAQDRDDDAALAALLRTRLRALEMPASRVDVDAVVGPATGPGRRPGTRRGAAWLVAGALAAAAAVVALVVLGGGHLPPAGRQGTVATQGAGGAAVSLRDGVPALPPEETARLQALQDRIPLAPPTYWATPFSSWTTVTDCSRRSPSGVEAAVLDGLDTRGLRQVCATAQAVGGRSDGDAAASPALLYRFYLPDGVDLDDVGLADATDRGVSWTVTDVSEPATEIQPEDQPADAAGGVTTVPRDDALASVRRWGPTRTDLAWVEPYARSDQSGTHPATVRAVVAAEPVTAVRAAVGFVNQGGIRALRGDDGSLLLVPSSDPLGGMAALTSGALTRTPDGCLGLDQGEGGFQLVLWPYGTTWDAGAQVLTVPAERGGEGEYRLGEQMSLGGGESDGRHARALVPAGCASEKVWIAGSAVLRA